MDKVKVRKDDVLQIIKDNRKKHKKDYYEAVKAYRVKVADLMAKELQKVVSGEEFVTCFSVSKPVSYLRDYDLAICMLELCISDTIELQANEFNQLVNDEWNWRSSFRSAVYSNSSYFGMSNISGTSGTSGSSGVSGSSGSSGTSWSYNVTFSEDELEDPEEN